MTRTPQSRNLADDDTLFRLLTVAVTPAPGNSAPANSSLAETADAESFAAEFAIPADALELAAMAPQLAALDGELAELVFDSYAADTLVLRDGGGSGRSLTYASGSVNLDLDVHADGKTIVGVVEPARWNQAVVETPTGAYEVRIDEHGRFRFVGSAHLVRFKIAGEAGRLLTPWLRR
jgi:hypothetical protein